MFPVLFPATSGNPPFSPKKVPGDLSESIPQQLWTARPDGALDFVNGRVLEYFGRTFEEMIARGWHDLIHPEDVDEAAERWMHSVATGCFYEVEVRLRHARDETYGWHLAQASADRDAQGTITRWVGTNTDLSRRPIAREKNAERREAEVTIRTQESQLRQIGDNLPDGFLYQLLAELNGIRRFIYFSAGMERITGVSMEEALGDAASLYGLIDPEDLSWMAAEEERCLKEGLNYDVVIRSRHRKTGEWRWIHIRSAPRMLPDGRRVWDGIYLDVTKARQTEEALARSMERLELAQRVGRIGVYDWLVKTGEVIRNEEQRRIFGLGAEESGETIEAFQKRVHPDDMERIRKEMAAVIARRQTDTDFTYRIVRNDGAIRWAEGAARFFYDEAGALQRMVGVNIDITEKQEAQRTLERSEASLRSIVESASASGIGIVRSHLDGRILEANDAFLRMVGYTREELASGRVNWRAMTPQEFLEVDAREIRKIEATRQSHSFEKEYLRKDGSRVPILLSANFVPGAEGEFICFVLDLSGPKSAQSALRDARDAAEAASNAKDHFLATLSHELRTPLAPVVPLLEELIDQEQLPEGVREDLHTIRRNIALETRLIDDLLDLTRVVRGKLQLRKEKVDLHRLLVESKAICCTAEVVANRIDTRLQYETRQSHLWADAGRLQQVFWNLLSNAYKFSFPGGTVVVRISDAPNAHVMVEVMDEGIGFSAEMGARLFRPFEQEPHSTVHERRGLGLGLAITKSLVEAHGGLIAAESEGISRGALFRVLLPIAPAEVRPGVPSGIFEGEGNGLLPRILLVEDHRDTGFIMERLLRKRGYEVRLAVSKAEALRIGAEEQFDILISDVGLPDGSGLEVMSALRGRSALIGIALSGFGMETDVQRSKAAGFAEHLVKPVNFAQLLQVLESVASVQSGRTAELSTKSLSPDGG